MKILVTGGAGFVGSHLCETLFTRGHEVICLDNFSTGRRANISHLIGRKGFRLIERDVTEPLVTDVDQIYNLACPASPMHYQRDPVKTVKTNVMGVINVLTLARHCKARILQASTSEVYGDPTVHPQSESYWGYVNPIGVRSCYDEGKRIAETLLMDHYRHHDVDIRIARIFNTYGPRMHEADGRVVSNFMVQAALGEPLTIYGTGEQTRSFCFVDDLVEGLIRLMNTAAVHEPVNLGNPAEFTIIELARQVSRLFGNETRLRFCALPEDDPRQRRPDVSRARALLGWSPVVPLAQGLKRTADYFRQSLRRTRCEAGARPMLQAVAGINN